MAYQLWTSLRTGDRRKGVTFNEVRNKFIDYLTTKFICEPLLSCKDEDNSSWVKEKLDSKVFDIAGVISCIEEFLLASDKKVEKIVLGSVKNKNNITK
jgi:hypothetical protein